MRRFHLQFSFLQILDGKDYSVLRTGLATLTVTSFDDVQGKHFSCINNRLVYSRERGCPNIVYIALCTYRYFHQFINCLLYPVIIPHMLLTINNLFSTPLFISNLSRVIGKALLHYIIMIHLLICTFSILNQTSRNLQYLGAYPKLFIFSKIV